MPWRARRACSGPIDNPHFAAHEIIVREYKDVFIAGQGLAIRAADYAIYRSTITQHTDYDLKFGVDLVQRAQAEGSSLRLDQPCVICVKPGEDNYGHWLIEMLPRAAYARSLGLVNLKYVVPDKPALAQVIRDSLQLLKIDESDIVPAKNPVQAHNAYGVYGMTQHGFFMSPKVLECLDEIGSKVRAASSNRIYVTRGDRHRRFQDEAGVCSLLKQYGYEVIDPAKLTLKQQIAAFKGAREIVGGMGAAMTNIAFARPDTKVTIFAPAAMSDNFYWFLTGIRGQQYQEIRCPAAPERKGLGRWDHDLAVPPQEVAAFLGLKASRRVRLFSWR